METNSTGKAILQWAASVLAAIAVAATGWLAQTTTENAQAIAVNYREMETRLKGFDEALDDIQERDIAAIRETDIAELRQQVQELREELARFQERTLQQMQGSREE